MASSADTIGLRRAGSGDAREIARLALLAGDGIPAYFWAAAKAPEQSLEDYGAQKAVRSEGNFACRNAWLAEWKGQVAGMLLGYRLEAVDDADLSALPAFIRPLIELEARVPGSFYLNMLAVYPAYRGRGIGRALLRHVDTLAAAAGCTLSSVEVFEGNAGAHRLYRDQGFTLHDWRDVVPHACHPYQAGERLLLLTRPVERANGKEAAIRSAR